jgi:hypothetical protein
MAATRSCKCHAPTTVNIYRADKDSASELFIDRKQLRIQVGN